MNGICGWAGYPAGTESAEDILCRMSGQKTLAAGHRAIAETGAIASTTGSGLAESGRFDNLLVGICGYPRWQDPGLQQQSLENGFAATIANQYASIGRTLLQRLHGSFSLAITDTASGRTLLAIDRLGIGTMACSIQDRSIVFGTSTTPITRHPLCDNDIDERALFDYFYFHMVPGPRSVYRGQTKLLPAECIEFHDGKATRSFYWEIPYRDNNPASFSRLREELLTLLPECVDDARDTETTGCFLSGGIDSSTVTGMLSTLQEEPVPTYSIGFNAEGFDETDFARAASTHFGTRHHEYYVTPEDVTRAVPLVAGSYDEPFGNASAIPTYYCARFAREHGTTTLLAGDGGDEIFGGNERYATQKLFELYDVLPSLARKKVIEPMAFSLPGAGRIKAVSKLRSYINQANTPLPDRMETYNFLHRSPVSEIFSGEFLDAADQNEPLDIIREVYHRTRGNSVLHRMLHLDMKNTLADNDLRKVSRMCELADMQVRYPLIDERLVEFSASVPPGMKIRSTRLRWFFKQALKDFLPPSTLKKSKHGFGLPFGLWLSSYRPLHELASDSLVSLRKRGFVRGEYIDDLLRKHESEHASYYGVMIWVMMMLEQWLAAHESANQSS